MSGMVACAFCGAEVQGNYRRVVGWERVRRSGGGLNRLVQRTETGEHACNACGHRLQHGVEPGAPSLFDVDEVAPIVRTSATKREHA